jgi:hypothetical protein
LGRLGWVDVTDFFEDLLEVLPRNDDTGLLELGQLVRICGGAGTRRDSTDEGEGQDQQ